MAPSRRQINGRSPLVNQQRQITAFFTNAGSSSSSPIISNRKTPKSKPNSSPGTPSPCSSPATPSPLQSKQNKPFLVIGNSTASSPSTPAVKSYGEEVVEKRIRVYWPLDKTWYEGCVKSYCKESGKHLVEYDDGEEESLDLAKEMIEWVQEQGGRFKRLRRGSSAFRKVVIEDEGMEDVIDEEDKSNLADADDSSDEDWGKNPKEGSEGSEDEDVELKDEIDDKSEGEEEDQISIGTRRGKTESRKRKGGGTGKQASGKKSKISGDICEGGSKPSFVNPVKNVEAKVKAANSLDSTLMGESLERFGARDAEKLWFLGVKRKDAERRSPGDENYDPRTLYLPPDFLKSLSGGQRQWWEFKAKHMNKVIFFKMGKFYELFEMDAHIGVKELDLQYMKGEQPHCGFPERNFSMNVEKLARKGYRVLVVEQTETPEQLELRRREKGSKDKVVRREICAVVTKGTLTEGEMLSANPDASYLLALTEGCLALADESPQKTFGVCLVDVATSRIMLGQFNDDQECSALCCLLAEFVPVEIIKPAKLLSPETERAILRHTKNPLVNELLPLSEFWDAEKTVQQINILYKRIFCRSSGSPQGAKSPAFGSLTQAGSGVLPKVLSDLVNAKERGSLALSALGGVLFYLRQSFLDETLLRFAKLERIPCSSDFSNIATKPYMVLDAAALENLEIFENSRNGGSSGTLYAQLNQCVTACGKRLLRTWLARPLYHSELIKERQDAIADLRGGNFPYSLEFRKMVSRLPDMERLLARVFSSSEANGRNGTRVVLYEDAAKKQLHEFISALRGCETIVQACSALGVILKNVKSRQLHHLLTPGQNFPDLSPVIRQFKDAFDWVEAHNSGRIVPHEGTDNEYDNACKTIEEVVSSLKKHLKDQRKLLGDTSISYVSVGKEDYLLEVPESLRGSVPRDYELRSSKKGFFRYWTPTIKKLLKELSQAESEKETALKSILQRLIGRFCEHHENWRMLISAAAMLDVLISLAIASDLFEGPACRPVIKGSTSTNGVQCLSAKALGHPILTSDSLGKGTFVPNDVSLGGDSARFILLTGPNMGGKSTFLRQVCLAVILAQVGADVPAVSFELSPVDRIFVRMGAKDHIMTGQSTFLTELSETALMLSSATKNSLVVLDELGRGTATSDGQAIAEAVLEHCVNKVQCRGMFSTHYHRLAIDHHRDPKVSLFHMACQVGNGAGGMEEVAFLYRLTPGACPKSYGVNVARLAGLPDSVLKVAATKSEELESIYGKSRRQLESKIGGFIQHFTSILSGSHPDNSPAFGLGSLIQLQNNARQLLQQA